MAHPVIDLPNARQPEPDLLTGGQPTRECLQAAYAAGYRTVVNLRPVDELEGFDEGRFARDLGFDYVDIPIAGPADLSRAAVELLDQVLTDAERRPALIHCASGNRVGALLALHGRLRRGMNVDEALAHGEATGLTAPALRAAVHEKLQMLDR